MMKAPERHEYASSSIPSLNPSVFLLLLYRAVYIKMKINI